jgi:1-acyl-sn-glycerol-3-phosphate acyltransferase
MAAGSGRRPTGATREEAAATVAAGARRASGERASRRPGSTPLLSVPDPLEPAHPGQPDAGRPGTGGAGPGSGRAGAGSGRSGAGRERLRAVVVEAERLGEQVAGAAGEIPTPEVEERLADALAFLRRRLTGDYRIDEYGFDPELTDSVLFALLRPLYRNWFRVEVRGIEHVPGEGGALLVANHSGAVALDAYMTAIAVHDEHPQHRFLRLLGADLVFRTPFVGELARKSGATLAASSDAERLLSAGELVGVWPEGFKGIGKPFSERYKLQRFGRGGFVSAALRTRTPIIPCAIVGAEETYPIIGNLPTLARLLGVPYLPVTPTWPLFGPLGLLPLPSKWLIEFGAPVPTDAYDPGAEEDPMLVFDLTDRVRQTIQQTLYALLMQRRSVFF